MKYLKIDNLISLEFDGCSGKPSYQENTIEEAIRKLYFSENLIPEDGDIIDVPGIKVRVTDVTWTLTEQGRVRKVIIKYE